MAWCVEAIEAINKYTYLLLPQPLAFTHISPVKHLLLLPSPRLFSTWYGTSSSPGDKKNYVPERAASISLELVYVRDT